MEREVQLASPQGGLHHRGARKACCPNASGTAPNAWSTLATCVRPADDESERKRSNVGDIAAPSRPSAKPATTRIALDAALRRRPEGVEGEAIMVMVAEGGAGGAGARASQSNRERARPIRPRR